MAGRWPSTSERGRLTASNGCSTPLVGTTERCETTYASVRGGVLRRSGSDPGDRRDELLEEGRKVGGSGPSVLGHCREGGELPGRSVFGLRGAYRRAGAPGRVALPARGGVGLRRRTAEGGGGARGADGLRQKGRTGAPDAGARVRCWCTGLVGDRRGGLWPEH